MARQTPLENGKKYNTSINVAGIQMLAWSHNAGAYSCSKYRMRGTTIWPTMTIVSQGPKSSVLKEPSSSLQLLQFL